MNTHECPMVSIVVPTYNRKELLRAALESLACLVYPTNRYEVIVVDDGSTDGTDRTIRNIMESGPLRLVYLRQPHAGVTAARNRAVRAARGEFILFTDDDCTFPPDWITRLLEPMGSATVGAVGGPDLAPEDATLFVQCVDYSVTSFVGTGGVRRKGKASLANYYPRGCNVVVRRTAIDRIGPFDPTLTAGEEIELGHRLKQAGYELRYAPGAFVFHHRRANWSGFARQMFARGMTRVELIRRHTGLFEWSYLIPPLLVLFLFAGAALYPFTAVPDSIYTVACLTYLLVLIAGGSHGAATIGQPRAALPIIGMLLLQHVLYGLGFWTEALQPRRKIPGYS